MCLAMFAVNYEVSYSENIADTEHSDNELQLEAEESHEGDHNILQKIKLQNGLGWMRKRNKQLLCKLGHTKSTLNQRNITTPNFYYITHGLMKSN